MKEASERSIIAHLRLGNNGQPIQTEDGMPLDFKDHAFMLDIYKDMASLKRDIVGLKAAQVTFTTTATNAVLWIAKNKQIDIIYTLPTFDDVRVFSGGKVNRIIAQNLVYQEWVSDKDTMEQKVVGKNIIHLRGTHSPKAATMVSSDLNVHDEVDASNQDVLEHYSTRLQHSDLKRTWWFSHPSVPGNGVDKKWELSDQKHWFIQCEACKKWQYLSWPDSLDMERKVYQCKQCLAVISDDMRRKGKWVAKKNKKDAKISGYWIPLLIYPRMSAADIIEYHKTKSPDYFYNKVLGLPYVGGGNKVMQQQIYQNLTSEINKQEGRIIIGLDTGIDLRYVIGNKDGIFYYGQCKDYDEIDEYLERWDRAILVADQGGDIIGIRKLRQKYPGRVFLAYYQSDKKSMQLVKWGESDESGKVMIDRNRMIQLVVDEFSERRIPLQYLESPDDWYDYWLHFSHIYRIATENKALKTMEYRWERSDRDDWVHATVYWRAGMARFGGKGSIERSSTLNPEPNSYFITPEGKTDSNPLKKVVEATYQEPESDDWRDA